MSVTVVSCMYGLAYRRFRGRWEESVRALERKPDDFCIVAPGNVEECPWRHPQAYYLQQAIEKSDTDWVWILDIDDTALPDALNGIDDVEADVWAMGYERSDGEVYIPPQLTAAEVLASPKSLIPGASAIRTEAFRACGGFSDVALQDWALWRALARNGATFESSERPHFRYNRHPATRGETELTLERRADHMAEMLAADGEPVAA